MNEFILCSILAFIAAVVISIGGTMGYWTSATDFPAQIISLLTLLTLLVNSILILRYVYRTSHSNIHRRIAWLCLLSFILCIGGDLINFNFPQTFYRHGGIVKHDYLADSVSFFGPGYLLLLSAVIVAAWHAKIHSPIRYLVFAIVSLGLAAASFASMYLPGTSHYVATITGAYGVLITAVGLSSVLLLTAYGSLNAPKSLWPICLGLGLAAAADAVIGAFWIYGNDGEGLFPLVRDINWVLYIGSQSLVVHLPLVMLKIAPDSHSQLQ